MPSPLDISILSFSSVHRTAIQILTMSKATLCSWCTDLQPPIPPHPSSYRERRAHEAAWIRRQNLNPTAFFTPPLLDLPPCRRSPPSPGYELGDDIDALADVTNEAEPEDHTSVHSGEGIEQLDQFNGDFELSMYKFHRNLELDCQYSIMGRRYYSSFIKFTEWPYLP